MKFGVSVCAEIGRHSDAVEQVRAAESLGYDSVWLPEHHLMTDYMPSPLLGLAAFSTITDRILLGTDVVLVPFYHPLRLAEDAAVLSDISEGRFLLGVGLGYLKEEFAAFNVPLNERGRRMDEYLSVIRKLLQEEAVTHTGEFVKLQEVTLHPRPKERIPIWVGGWAEPALRRAALLGDAWFPGPTADMSKLLSCLDIYDKALKNQGTVRKELPVFREVWVGKNKRELDYGIERLQQQYLDHYVAWEHANVKTESASVSFHEIAADRFFVGSPEEVAQYIVQYAEEIGMTHLVARMQFHGSDQRKVLRSMELFAEEVIPLTSKELSR